MYAVSRFEQYYFHSEKSHESTSGSVTASVGSGGMSFMPTLSHFEDEEHGTTNAAIFANGTVEVRNGNLNGISRDTQNANNGSLKPLDIEKYQEQQEIAGLIGEVGNRAVGDIGKAFDLEDGSAAKLALHGIVGAAQAKASGGNAASGAAAAVGSTIVNNQVADYLANSVLVDTEERTYEKERNSIQQITALASGYAIGGATGGSGNALIGANVAKDAEAFNRQLHDKEIKKIKEIAPKFATVDENGNLDIATAEDRLMEQAMRDIDEQYYNTHAGYNHEAENFLRNNAVTFVDENGETMVMFVPNKDYRYDSSKYAEQQGYATERNRLSQLNNQYSAKDRTNDINYKTNDAIVGGTIKGIKNVPSNLINGGATLLNNVFHTDAVPLVQPAARYANEAEAFVGNQVGENVVNAVSIVTVGLGSVAREVKATSIANQEAQAARNAAKVESNIYTDQTYHPNVTQPARVNKTSKGTSIEYVADGDLAKARIDFDAFKPTNVTTTLNKKGELVTVGKLSNGGEVKLRPSNDGGRHRWTIEVRKPNGKVSREIRYGNQ